jgi:hypothetical protein
MKIFTQESFPPLTKGVRGIWFLLFRHCEERSDVAISVTQFVILRSPVSFSGRRENLIILNLIQN